MFVGQINTTELQPETPLSADPEKWPIHKYLTGNDLGGGTNCRTDSMASPQHECVESSAVLQWSDLRLMRALVERLRSVGHLFEEEMMENCHVTAPIHSVGSDAVS